MQLKKYQLRSLREFEAFLLKLRAKQDAVEPLYPALKAVGSPLPDPSEMTWKELFPTHRYIKRVNAVNEPVPNICLKIPTGGGKTLLACHALASLNRVYRHSNFGMVLWIVPTDQIYRQTLRALKDRDHSYRRALDNASGGRTKIVEKDDRFEPEDVRDSLVVMVMMLQSANRKNQDYLKAFKSSGKFQAFFPESDRYDLNEPLIKEHGLDVVEDIFTRLSPKTSLGNVMKRLRPVMIVDEGQKASSFLARDTLFGLNPSFVIELTATPINGVSNTLVQIGGLDLLEEGMIKLDMNVTTKASEDWRDTIREAIAKLDALAKEAETNHSNTSVYIRPICLIQAERTGKDQRGAGFVHSEDVREVLVKEFGRSPAEIAVKSSSLDELGDTDLLSKDCPIRFIITKQALQEGWDCSFAYILAILTNPKAKLAITQLVGRILRQPYATKTKIKPLDESYVVCRRSSTRNLIDEIRNGLKDEGLGDLEGHIHPELGGEPATKGEMIEIGFREKFRLLADSIFLPRFVIDDSPKPRNLDYEMDLLARVNWNEFDLEWVEKHKLLEVNAADIDEAISLADDPVEAIKRKTLSKRIVYLEPEPEFMTRQISDIIANPWEAFRIANGALEILLRGHDRHQIGANLNRFLDTLREHLFKFRDDRAKSAFKDLLDSKKLCFYLIRDHDGKIRPTKLIPKEGIRRLEHSSIEPIQSSLFEIEDRDQYNELERSVALCLDKQEKLLWWYRNISRAGYWVQGWREHRVYPDFLASEQPVDEHSRVLVLETKGEHLAGNLDTEYKESLFELCTRHGVVREWSELGLGFPNQQFIFKIVKQTGWESEIEALFT